MKCETCNGTKLNPDRTHKVVVSQGWIKMFGVPPDYYCPACNGTGEKKERNDDPH